MWASVAKGNRQYVEFAAQVLLCSEYRYFWAENDIEAIRPKKKVLIPSSRTGIQYYIYVYIYIYMHI